MKYTCPHCRWTFSVNPASPAPVDDAAAVGAAAATDVAAPAARDVRCPKCQRVYAARPVRVSATRAATDGRADAASLDDQVLRWLEEEADANSEMVRAALAASLAVNARTRRAVVAVATAL